MRIRFLRRVVYETEGRERGQVYEADSVHDFSDSFARRWLRRDVAVETDEPVRKCAKPAPKPKAEKAAEPPAKSAEVRRAGPADAAKTSGKE